MKNFDKKVSLILNLNNKLKNVNSSLQTVNLNIANPILKKHEANKFNNLMRSKINITNVLCNMNYLNY
jgi:hypothetical protein